MVAQQTSTHEGRISVHHHIGPAHAHGAVTHTEHALVYLAAGTAHMAYGHPIVAEAGAFILVPAGVPHRALDGGQTERWAVGFCAACLQLSEAEPIMAPFVRVRLGGAPVVLVAPERQQRVVGLLQDLREECDRSVPESAVLQHSLLSLLLGEVRRGSSGEATTEPTSSLVAEALTYIQGHSLEAISLADVAQAVCRSPAHVASRVKAATGYTVGEWIRHARVNEGAAWRLHSDAAIDEIAERVGWQDKTHFIRQFKKTYGLTPMAWRKARRG